MKNDIDNVIDNQKESQRTKGNYRKEIRKKSGQVYGFSFMFLCFFCFL